MNKRVLIVGGYGETGRSVAKHLLERLEVNLVIAGRNLRKAELSAAELCRSYGEGRAIGVGMDAGNVSQLRPILEECAVIVNAGPAFGEDVLCRMASTAINANTHWIDVQFNHMQEKLLLSFDEKARKNDVCFCIQSGFHPGLPAAMVRWAEKKMDEMEEAEVSAFLNPGGGLKYTQGVDELVGMFRDYKGHHYHDGKWNKATMWKVDFQLGIGRRDVAAMTLGEMLPLPNMIPTLKKTGFAIGGFSWVANWIVTPFMMFGLKVFPFIPLSAWGRLLCWSIAKFGREPFITALQLDAKGIVNGERHKATLVVSHKEEYELTAVPVVAMLEQMLEGGNCRPGVHYAALMPDVDEFFAAIEEMGIKFFIKAGRLDDQNKP